MNKMGILKIIKSICKILSYTLILMTITVIFKKSIYIIIYKCINNLKYLYDIIFYKINNNFIIKILNKN